MNITVEHPKEEQIIIYLRNGIPYSSKRGRAAAKCKSV
jgi:hypothetical protein